MHPGVSIGIEDTPDTPDMLYLAVVGAGRFVYIMERAKFDPLLHI